ncbi:hypothetical protein K3N28_19075 [Glycomyces sp. TRM65418]|uniref:hypothetical protein n=1 Tax=Glycomyces sp. TRM65418 TaxID=2867006 RepID=UPI001CE527E1|nr:hypothetical protein [Glycomyces sp. TRM65418]MCC3765164.1 hypothetical protein [Glycomyces sp. TRM65418]QZD54790.1 hypothetical protein K3N28_18980 [Glycomyces sp. TRM65418]
MCEDHYYDFDPRADVPVAAAHALSEDLMLPALVDLACLRHEDRAEIRTLIPQLFTEAGRPLPSKAAAAFARAKAVAQQCLDGLLSPDEAIVPLIRFLMRVPSCGGMYCHDEGDILRFEETHHAGHNLEQPATGTVPDWFPDNDAAEQFREFLHSLTVSDHECA